jgi:hypothetical protein
MKTYVYLWQYLAEFFLEWKMFEVKGLEKIKTYILYSITFSENRAVFEIMCKNIVESDMPQMIL